MQPNGVTLPSFVTASADFYRVDTALSVPQLSHGDWRLHIHGMVDREITYSFADLARFDVVETVTTLTCVSNPVGGKLISTGIWTGYRLADLLAAAGVHADADMVLSTSIDGFTAGTPVAALTDGRDALLAVGLNGQPLPIEHGYPARLVVPGLYGYVSATKWVVDMELTRFDRAKAYWTRHGWAAQAPIKTESRIDVPKSGQRVPAGPWYSAVSRGPRFVACGPWRSASTTAHGSPRNKARAIPSRRGGCGAFPGRRKALENTPSPCAPSTTPELSKPQIRLIPSRTAPPAGTRWPSPWSSRHFPPTEHRDDDADQRGYRTDDGPGRGVAHRATPKHTESLQRPDQTEQRDEQPDRECHDESPSHTGMLRPGVSPDISDCNVDGRQCTFSACQTGSASSPSLRNRSG
ncbi:oxidoreductase molybdopterin binding domain protein [Mycobacterium kansasii]|uniref:Oxidoreductase molybdopterin binding domain protein n=1 Tax=Mycobacterium kansasii TaxID=1768 RepID=A0A1V3WXY2_MYCKA|nr:oxidoreductase molybdopterin binding domain protein [Mycobacterium kansasii]